MPEQPNDRAEPADITTEEEVAILLRAKEDRRAFEPLYHHYAPRIFGYCRRRLGHSEDAADATSQTFIKALAGIDGFSGGAVAPWIFTIARHVVIDAVRRRRPDVDLESAHELIEPAAGPHELAILMDQRRALFDSMGRLTAEQRDVVELRLAGLTGREIADVLHLSLSAVKSSQFRAYTRLRSLLADERIFGAAE